MIDASGHCSIPLAFVSVSLALVLIGCPYPHTVHKSDKNRPGDAEISEPPPQKEFRERVHPDDPGGFTIATSLRPVVEYGPYWLSETPRDTQLQFGAELSLSLRPATPIKHTPYNRESILFQNLIGLPYGLVFGWLPFHSHSAVDSHRLYAQLDVRAVPIGRISAGWSVWSDATAHGPVFTLGITEFFHLRTDWDIGRSVSLLFGASVPFYYIYARSR